MIETLMQYETAGDPITELKWTRKTTQKLCQELNKCGVQIHKNSVGRILKQLGDRIASSLILHQRFNH